MSNPTPHNPNQNLPPEKEGNNRPTRSRFNLTWLYFLIMGTLVALYITNENGQSGG